MAKILGKEMEVDLNNLTRTDFEQLAQYVQFLENHIEEIKSTALALMTQRNNLHKQLEEIKRSRPVDTTFVYNAPIDTEVELVNPDQWAVPAGKVITTDKAK